MYQRGAKLISVFLLTFVQWAYSCIQHSDQSTKNTKCPGTLSPTTPTKDAFHFMKGKDYSFVSFIHFWQRKLVLTAFILDINESYSIKAVSGFFHCKLCLWNSFIFLVFSLLSWCSVYVCYLIICLFIALSH